MGGLALTKYSPEGGIQMGRKNKAYFKDLHQQAYEKLIASNRQLCSRLEVVSKKM